MALEYICCLLYTSEQVTIDKVSNNDNSNNESTSSSKIKSDNSGIIKNVVLESKVVSIESVDEVVRECEERLGGQRADFPQVYNETGFSPWCYED